MTYTTLYFPLFKISFRRVSISSKISQNWMWNKLCNENSTSMFAIPPHFNEDFRKSLIADISFVDESRIGKKQQPQHWNPFYTNRIIEFISHQIKLQTIWMKWNYMIARNAATITVFTQAYTSSGNFFHYLKLHTTARQTNAISTVFLQSVDVTAGYCCCRWWILF